jgi:hypothetical protein
MPTVNSKSKPANVGELPPERPAKAEMLRPLIGEMVDFIWGVGSQQNKYQATGILQEVNSRYILLHGASELGAMRIPLSFLIRFQQ